MQKSEIELNSFATRCFRDVADRDYICARMCYRASLISQFHWSALQAFEKYFKAILLYNRIKAKNVGHNLVHARELSKKVPFEIELSETSENLLGHLDTYGRFRYLETSYFTKGPKLFELDKAVWELRRYCRVLNYTSRNHKNELVPMLEPELNGIKYYAKRPPQEFTIIGGALERIIGKSSDPARTHLVWQNAFYGRSRRKSVSIPTYLYAENSPLFLNPKILDDVLEYVHLPKEVIDAFRKSS